MRRHHDGPSSLPRRVVVIGTTGSGKTTVAARIAAIIGAPHVELDALFWGPNWTQVDDELFLQRVADATAGETWVTDGNYTQRVRQLSWRRADTLVWLDYAFPRIIWRLSRRTIGRIVRDERLWQGNRETFRGTFLSRDSLLVWAVKTHWRHRREWPPLLRAPEFAHVRVERLRAPAATARWLRGLTYAASNPPIDYNLPEESQAL